MTDEEWREHIIELMTKAEWQLDIEDENILGFFFIEGDKKWIRDYDKKTRRFVQFDANQKVNLQESPW